MRRLIAPLLACLLTCDVSHPQPPTAPVTIDAAPVVNNIVLPTVEVVSVRVPRRVLITGDSEACRVAFYVKDTVALINKENGEPADVVDVDCKGGTVVDYWGKYGNLKRALKRHPTPDDILVFLGTNHYWNEKDTPDVSPILDEIAWSKANCIWVGNTAVHGRKWNINNLLRAAVTPQCSYFDTEAADIPLDDGVHPGRAGAVKWLRLVWKTIPPKYKEQHDD